MSDSIPSTTTDSSLSTGSRPARPTLDTSKFSSDAKSFKLAAKSFYSLYYILYTQEAKAVTESQKLNRKNVHEAQAFKDFGNDTLHCIYEVWEVLEEEMRETDNHFRRLRDKDP
ncbi:MAG: hypothetical protein Q9226_006171 [Calogaya cf. arnoldii]